MSETLKVLKRYFEAGTAEGDESFLPEVFVTFNEYLEVVSVPKSGPRILLGNKGSGKSAVLRFFRSQLSLLGIPVILLRPKDIEFKASNESALGPLTRSSESAIINSIAAKIGSNINGIVINKEDKKLLTVAQTNGDKDKDIIENLTALLSPIGKAFSKIDFSLLSRTPDVNLSP